MWSLQFHDNKNVLDILKDIQANKSTDIDNIGAKILKKGAPAVAPSITKIIKLMVPVIWYFPKQMEDRQSHSNLQS